MLKIEQATNCEGVELSQTGVIGIDWGVRRFATLSTGQSIHWHGGLKNPQKFIRQAVEYLINLEGITEFVTEPRYIGERKPIPSWRSFVVMLQKRCQEENLTFFEAGWNIPTSKVCSSCMVKNPYCYDYHSMFKCGECGFEINRDINAARNLALWGEEWTKNPFGFVETNKTPCQDENAVKRARREYIKEEVLYLLGEKKMTFEQALGEIKKTVPDATIRDIQHIRNFTREGRVLQTRLRSSRYTPEQELEVCRLYKSGLTRARVSRETGIPTTTVFGMLQRHGISLR